MARKRTTREAHNPDRWLVSYADFTTLLFAFFVVMFASSEANQYKARRVSAAVEKALAGGVGSSEIRQPVKPERPAPARDTAELASSLRLLEAQLATEINSGKIKMSLQQRGLVVSLSEAGFFQPGDDRIEPSMYEAFGKLSEALRQLPNPVRLEGHTDSVPIHNPRFRNNWDLSTARALAVLTLLEETYAIGRTRLSAAGYADTAPVESNETEAGRAHNRRVDLVILSGSGMAGEPGGAPPSPST